jgi:exonuclease III
MRLVTWNCRIGGFRWKAKQVAPLRPDVLVVQEVEPRIDRELFFDGERQPTYRDRIGDPAYPRGKAIGVFSYTDTKLESVDAADPMLSFRRYKAQHGDLKFQVVGVWTWKTALRATTFGQARAGLEEHSAWIAKRPTVLLGDFNANASFKGPDWGQLADLLARAGLVSAYHTFYSEPFGTETRRTHFHKGKETGQLFHLDYCFLPDFWAKHIKKVEVGTYHDWHTLSDHAPLIVDLDL